MPSDWLYIDTNFPTFTKEQGLSDKVTTIQNYLFLLVEQLRYSLRNLDLTNMNQTAVEQYTNSITDPIYRKISDSDGNITQLQITAQGLAMQISNAQGDINQLQITASSLTSRISNAQGDISTLQQTATSLTSQISTAQGNISTLQQTASSLTSQISNAQWDISTLQQTASSLSTSIRNAKNDISTLQQTADDLTISVGNLETGMGTTLTLNKYGMVVYGNGGSVTINGGCLDASTVTATSLRGQTVKLLSADGDSVGGISLAYTTTGWGLSLYTSRGGLRVQSDDKLYLSADNKKEDMTFQFGAIQTNCTFRTSDADASLGDSTHKWDAVYASTGEIQTSDENFKTDIQPLPDKYLEFSRLLQPVRFRMVNGSSGRFHVGFIAQRVKEAMDRTGIDPLEFAGWCKGCDEDGNELQMLRYGEFIAILLGRIGALEDRVAGLEGNP